MALSPALVRCAACPSSIRREVASVFPGVDIDTILIVPTCQRAVMDLVQVGDVVEVEKDKLLEQASHWRGGGAWAARGEGSACAPCAPMQELTHVPLLLCASSVPLPAPAAAVHGLGGQGVRRADRAGPLGGLH
jgi:hypothetical protein